jgi:uncharacterized protein YjiS (DUF1127 family)
MSAQLGSPCSAPTLSRAGAAPRPGRGIAPDLAGGLTRLGHWLQVMRTRGQLEELDDRLLRDIGLSRPEAEAERRRAPWDSDRRP